MDVLAADSGGATAVGVLTGIYTREELEKTGVGGQIHPLLTKWDPPPPPPLPFKAPQEHAQGSLTN